MDDTIAWYALKTRSRHEKLVARALSERGIECFLPLAHERRAWSDRIRLVSVPIFPTYLFVRVRPEAMVAVRGAVALVHVGARPAPVPEAEVAALRALAKGGVALERHRFLRRGQRVRIRSGPLRGIEGTLVRRHGRERLVVNVEIFRQGAAVTLDGIDVEAA